mmetsp:Transcript_5073/g.7659  ORF Transcript_5073/g.7659 Transcript_5073/m.7659 type:complete len:504 (-) Transcript_5073:61-1572(-)
MGACCGTQPIQKDLKVKYEDQTKTLKPAPSTVEVLKESVSKLFPDLEEFNVSTVNNQTLTDQTLQKLVKSQNPEVYVRKKDLEELVDLSGGIVQLKHNGTEHLGFVTNLNLLMTTNKVLPTKDSALKVDSEYPLDPETFFYSNKALFFSLVALKSNIHSELLPIVSKQIKPGDTLICSNSSLEVRQVTPYSFSYVGEFMPGSPLLLDGKVVGMHTSKNNGLNIQALIQELQSVSSVHTFSKKINELLDSIVFQDIPISPQERFNYIYGPAQSGLTCFNTKLNEVKQISVEVPKQGSLCQSATGVYITGGLVESAPTDTTYFFDTYTATLIKKKSMVSKRAQHASAISNTHLYAISGRNENELTNECEALDLKKNVWYPIYPTNIARVGHSATYYAECVYVVGGTKLNGEPAQEIEKFNGETWEVLSIKPPEVLSSLKVLSGKLELMLLGTHLWEFLEGEFKQLSSQREELPGEHSVYHKGHIYSFSPTSLLVWDGSFWKLLKF